MGDITSIHRKYVAPSAEIFVVIDERKSNLYDVGKSQGYFHNPIIQKATQ